MLFSLVVSAMTFSGLDRQSKIRIVRAVVVTWAWIQSQIPASCRYFELKCAVGQWNTVAPLEAWSMEPL